MNTNASTFGAPAGPPTDKHDMTYPVYCHVCEHPNDKVPRNRARMIGSAKFGGLWHCADHGDTECGCPRGDYTEPRRWWELPRD